MLMISAKLELMIDFNRGCEERFFEYFSQKGMIDLKNIFGCTEASKFPKCFSFRYFTLLAFLNIFNAQLKVNNPEKDKGKSYSLTTVSL